MLPDTHPLPQFVFTKPARELIDRIYHDYQSPLVLMIANGCCESTAPYLYANYLVSEETRVVWEDHQVAVHLSNHLVFPDGSRFRQVIDVEPNVLGDSFSIETDYGSRLVLRREQIS
ncbi:DUF779 domain-containing protein [Effusibacillus dendaii]|uniref:DUF779 domain-containing protein n=1 Tax=Effusibacillus dendaii TaxID=2743772 RepID=A0A7I8DIR7_9BACL|nr:DUF779 domain-containing protein [Effusibacillus dendaii]BCJ88550.1 hypothetical protein skT53_35350 [Effusibacillus dendaii]